MIFIIAIILLAAMWLVRREGVKEGRSIVVTAGTAGMLVMFLVAVSCCLTIVDAGYVGVVNTFGSVADNSLKAGINLVNPFARIIQMSVKTQEIKEVMDVPSKEGLTVNLEISVLYHLNPEKAADIYKTVGEQYETVILEPQFRSITRGVTSGFEAKALYTSERELLSLLILKQLDTLTERRGVIIESAPLRKVGLPAGLSQSIEAKLQAEQESQRMEFVLSKERQEAARKTIEAQGIKDFQEKAQFSVSYLEWLGIQATKELANSANAKTVIIGGKNGMPLIFNAGSDASIK